MRLLPDVAQAETGKQREHGERDPRRPGLRQQEDGDQTGRQTGDAKKPSGVLGRKQGRRGGRNVISPKGCCIIEGCFYKPFHSLS